MTLKETKTKTKIKAEKIMRKESETNIIDIISNFLHNQRPHFQNSFS